MCREARASGRGVLTTYMERHETGKQASEQTSDCHYLRAGKARCQPEGVRVESLEDMQIVLVLDGMKIREACLAPRPSSQVQVCNEARKHAMIANSSSEV